MALAYAMQEKREVPLVSARFVEFGLRQRERASYEQSMPNLCTWVFARTPRSNKTVPLEFASRSSDITKDLPLSNRISSDPTTNQHIGIFEEDYQQLVQGLSVFKSSQIRHSHDFYQRTANPSTHISILLEDSYLSK